MSTNELTLLLAIVSGIVTLGTAYFTYKRAGLAVATSKNADLKSAIAVTTAQLAEGRANTAKAIAEEVAVTLKSLK